MKNCSRHTSIVTHIRRDRRWRVLLIALSGIAITGCRSAESFTKLEQELRGREAQIRTLQSQIADSEQQLLDQDQQLAAHRTPSIKSSLGNQFAMVSQSASMPDDDRQIPEEVFATWGSVDNLQIQKLVSGIHWDSGQPILHIVIRPVDAEGELCKVVGQLSVQATTVPNGSTSKPLVDASWTITESRDLWTNAFVSSGFHARTPISNTAAARDARQLLVTATLKLGQGRTFEATETLNLPVSAK